MTPNAQNVPLDKRHLLASTFYLCVIQLSVLFFCRGIPKKLYFIADPLFPSWTLLDPFPPITFLFFFFLFTPPPPPPPPPPPCLLHLLAFLGPLSAFGTFLLFFFSRDFFSFHPFFWGLAKFSNFPLIQTTHRFTFLVTGSLPPPPLARSIGLSNRSRTASPHPDFPRL